MATISKTIDKIKEFQWLLVWMAIAVAIYARCQTFFAWPSFYIDEANLALNIVERDYTDFFQPLGYEQYAPPLFLVIIKTLGLLFGYNDVTFRIFPFICSIISFILIYRLTKKYIDSALAIVLVIIPFSLSYWAILEACSVKQYMSDLLICLALCLYTLQDDYRRFFRPKELVKWSVGGAVLVWLSMPVVFTMAAIGAYYAWQAYKGKEFWKWLKFFIIPVAIWIGNFGAYFFSILQSEAKSDYLQNFHSNYFVNLHEGLWWNVDLLQRIFKEYIGEFIIAGINIKFVALMLFYLLGMFKLIKERIQVFFLFSLPFGLCLFASTFGYYSLIERLLLFTIPVQFIIVGIGIDLMAKSKVKVIAYTHILVVGGILYGIIGWQFFYKGVKAVLENTRYSLEYIHQHRKPYEAVLANHRGRSVAKYYIEYHSDRNEKFANCAPYYRDESPYPRPISDVVVETFEKIKEREMWVLIGHLEAKDADEQVAKMRENPNIEVGHEEKQWRSRAVKVRWVKKAE